MKLFGKRKQQEIEFDFAKIEDVDDATVRAFFANTHDKSRRMPLLIARHIYGQLEDALTSPNQLNALMLSEIRGAMRALRAFGVAYTHGIDEWKRNATERQRGE